MTRDARNVGGAFLIPAYNPGQLLLEVVTQLRAELGRTGLGAIPIVVVDDGCTDGSTQGLPVDVTLLQHPHNLGKGAALQTGLRWAQTEGIAFLVSLDADNQHPVREAVRLFTDEAPESALILAVRDLKKAGAPRKNQLSNAFSNWILSLLGGRKLRDTQCGLRRYPVEATCSLGATHPGYAFESDLVLRAARKGLPIFELDTEVTYPHIEERVSHFHPARDPAKNVLQVLKTTWEVPRRKGL